MRKLGISRVINRNIIRYKRKANSYAFAMKGNSYFSIDDVVCVWNYFFPGGGYHEWLCSVAAKFKCFWERNNDWRCSYVGPTYKLSNGIILPIIWILESKNIICPIIDGFVINTISSSPKRTVVRNENQYICLIRVFYKHLCSEVLLLTYYLWYRDSWRLWIWVWWWQRVYTSSWWCYKTWSWF